MIIDALLALLHGILQTVNTLLPGWNFTLPQFNQLIQMLLFYDSILPVHEALAVIGITIYLEVGFTGTKWSIKVIDYICDVIP